MEAGYDYLLLRGGFRRQFAKYAGIGLIALGVMLLASGGAYYGYAAVARADLDRPETPPPPGTGWVQVRLPDSSQPLENPAVRTGSPQTGPGWCRPLPRPI